MLVTNHLKSVVFATIMWALEYITTYLFRESRPALNNRVLNLPINLSSTLICTHLNDIVINTIFHSSIEVMKRLFLLNFISLQVYKIQDMNLQNYLAWRFILINVKYAMTQLNVQICKFLRIKFGTSHV